MTKIGKESKFFKDDEISSEVSSDFHLILIKFSSDSRNILNCISSSIMEKFGEKAKFFKGDEISSEISSDFHLTLIKVSSDQDQNLKQGDPFTRYFVQDC